MAKKTFKAWHSSHLNGTWHRSCYQSSIHKNHIERAKKRYERQVRVPTNTENDSQTSSGKPFLRSQTEPRKDKRTTCFFCNEPETQTAKLYMATYNKTDNNRCGADLKAAIEKSNNQKLKIKLSEALDPNDALAIDVLYHPYCWRDNVDHVLRGKDIDESLDYRKRAAEFAAKIEFFTLLKGLLRDGETISMKDAHDAYIRIQKQCEVEEPEISRRTMKRLIKDNISDVEFHPPKQKNESELLSAKLLRDKLVDDFNDNISIEKSVESIYNAAKVLRKAILESPKW